MWFQVERNCQSLTPTYRPYSFQARAGIKDIPKQALPFLLPGVAVARYLERLRVVNFRLVNQSLLQRDSMLSVALYWNKFRGKF